MCTTNTWDHFHSTPQTTVTNCSSIYETISMPKLFPCPSLIHNEMVENFNILKIGDWHHLSSHHRELKLYANTHVNKTRDLCSMALCSIITNSSRRSKKIDISRFAAYTHNSAKSANIYLT